MMDNKNKNNNQNNDRKNIVQNFVINIDDIDDKSDACVSHKKNDDFSNRPENKGEVYFANYQKNRKIESDAQCNNNSANAQNKPMDNINLSAFDKQKAEIEKEKRMQERENTLKNIPKNYTKRFMISLISIILITCILSGVGIGAVNDVLAINGSSEEVEIELPEKVNTKQVVKLLKKKKLVNNKNICEIVAKLRNFKDDGYMRGRYYLSTDMGIEGMLNILQQKTISEKDETVTLAFPEGYTIQQFLKKLSDNEVISNKDNFLSSIQYDYGYELIDNKNEKIYLKLEGFLFPDTYEFYIGESPSSVVRKLLANFQKKWTPEFTKRAKEMGFSVAEIITIASIIQKEAADVEQMSGISAVIHNRLKRSVDYPLLQCDSTINYVEKYISQIFPENKTKQNSEYYDTYVSTGLTPGPICNPGLAAIKAALYPEENSNNLYFCHDKNGKIYYATNDIVHSRNVATTIKVNAE